MTSTPSRRIMVVTHASRPDAQQLAAGVATRLLVELVRQSRSLGANQLTLEVRMSNVRAQELYRRFGFAPAGARKAYVTRKSVHAADALAVAICHALAPPLAALVGSAR